MNMDITKAIRVAIQTGKVKFGLKETWATVKKKEAKLVIISSTCVDKEKLMNEYKPVYLFDGTAKDLGKACGKPFNVSTIAILDQGTSGILALGEEKI